MPSAYYDGGFRAVIGGVPTRLARRPSKATLAQMQERNCYHTIPSPNGDGPLVLPCRNGRDCDSKNATYRRYREGR